DGGSVNFQSVIALLHHFWTERGCLIAQPYDIGIPNVVVSRLAQLKLTGEGCPLSLVISKDFKPIYVS
ncbi:MAG: hypothetical protein V7K69_27000, partial [Nostoc sp.]|uniref:hypothetical protein n=1 Tax=Nostoc sp. TaxID=1180 RepID=UPI002FFCD53A